MTIGPAPMIMMDVISVRLGMVDLVSGAARQGQLLRKLLRVIGMPNLCARGECRLRPAVGRGVDVAIARRAMRCAVADGKGSRAWPARHAGGGSAGSGTPPDAVPRRPFRRRQGKSATCG